MRAAQAVPNHDKLRIVDSIPVTSGSMGDKLHAQKGKSPDHQLRPQNNILVLKDVRLQKQPGGLLRGSYPLKSA